MEMQRRGMLAEFKSFIANGNVLDLAVAIVIGVAFGGVIGSLVEGILMPLVAAIAGQPSFDSLTWTVGDSTILYGSFLTQVFNFLVVGAAMFMVVRVASKLQQRRVVDLDEDIQEPTETELLTEIRDLLTQDVRTAR